MKEASIIKLLQSQINRLTLVVSEQKHLLTMKQEEVDELKALLVETKQAHKDMRALKYDGSEVLPSGWSYDNEEN